jgi:hypothetical protein
MRDRTPRGLSVIGIQRRLREAGRIRIGAKVPVREGTKTRPSALGTFRLTSRQRQPLDALAAYYGGEVRAWEGQWEVITEADALDVLLPPPAMGWSQAYELWSGGQCRRRCDGEREVIGDTECLCDPEAPECQPHSRLSVLLARWPTAGLWRLETRGWHAAAELAGAVELVEIVQRATGASLVPARLLLEQRTVRRDNETRHFAVPVLDVELTGVTEGNREAPAALPASVTPLPPLERPSVSEALAALEAKVPKRTARSAAPVTTTPLAPAELAARAVGTAAPAPAPPAPSVPEAEPGPTKAQLSLMHVLARKCGLATPEARRAYVGEILGREVATSRDVTQAEMARVIDTLQVLAGEEPPPAEPEDEEEEGWQ